MDTEDLSRTLAVSKDYIFSLKIKQFLSHLDMEMLFQNVPTLCQVPPPAAPPSGASRGASLPSLVSAERSDDPTTWRRWRPKLARPVLRASPQLREGAAAARASCALRGTLRPCL